MEDTSIQGHGGADLTGASNNQQQSTIADAPTTDATMIHATASSPVATESCSRGNHTTQGHKESKVKEQSVDTPNASQQQTQEEGGIHQGSKRHKESKHGHYGGEQQAKKQKKRIDLVDPEEDLKNAQYFFDNDLRKIKPYFFKYQTYAKGRWLGRKLIEVFNTEFRDRDNTFYERAIKDGRVKINGETVDKDYIIKNSDIVAHDIHRHEPPVANLPVKVVRNVDGVIIVDKPSSVPVHPSGRYRHNTVLHILSTEQGYKDLYPVNRLDRLTSGLMIIALSVKKAREFEKMMQKCEIKKEYVCKVRGEFPSGVTECHQPIHVASFKLTLNTVQPDGKACSTIFQRLRYEPESDTSIVLARPVTGRTHQIRVHLQWLGHPITNDPLYHNTEIWGAQNGQGGITMEAEEELVKRLLAQTEAEDELDHALATSSLKNSEASTNSSSSEQYQKAEFCSICQLPSRADPEPEKRIMYLHAWKYQAKDWAFETELPDWARETVLAYTAASSPDQGTDITVPEHP
ncbi:hypothetical protein BGZ96_009709 [Linnemannia gamsii]|uniref:Pseudouridine synthase RsuA/RluA-like domain-containing protein n=1 Tax=Linnemannia gamsii TaxID=64522 RepID=A0ABQ7KGY1_9FUNG|nr:hypothetical protein BGZ96_009709 [Linnemannia gamsii]